MNGCFNCKHQNTNICSYCRTLIGECWEHQVKTNADHIRKMTDEELAEWLAYGSMPKEVRNGMNNGAFETRADAFLWWLKQECVE